MRADSVYSAEKISASPQGRKASLSWSTNGNTPASGIIELEHGAAARRHQVGLHAVDRDLTVVHAVQRRAGRGSRSRPLHRMIARIKWSGASGIAGFPAWWGRRDATRGSRPRSPPRRGPRRSRPSGVRRRRWTMGASLRADRPGSSPGRPGRRQCRAGARRGLCQDNAGPCLRRRAVAAAVMTRAPCLSTACIPARANRRPAAAWLPAAASGWRSGSSSYRSPPRSTRGSPCRVR